jgi:predicted HTH transcriptional regulator
MQKYFWDNINNPQKTNRNILMNEDVRIIEVKDVSLLAFHIPIAKRTDKPVYLTRNPFGNTYKRNHEGDYKCTDEEVRRMLADADTNLNHDSRILEGYSLDDLDESSLKKYRQLFASVKPAHPWLALEIKEFLEKLGAYRKDRVSKKEGLTLAGMLMFGKESSIIDQECAPNYFPDFREILSPELDVRWTDRVIPDGTWECNLFQFYLKIWPRLSSSIPKPFQLKDGVRQDETAAHTALREAFVNALIHADYSATGSIIIEQRAERFSFSNPGTLLVSINQYYHGGISECRNPSLQKMFFMIGTAEKAGSGVSKIMSGWDQANWGRPYLRVDSQPDRLTLELPMTSIIHEETIKQLKYYFGEDVTSLGKEELTILSTCQIEGETSNYRLQFLIEQHRSEITRILQDLCKQGYLTSDNKGRWTTYHLNTEFRNNANVGTLHNANVDSSDASKVNTSKSANVDSSLKLSDIKSASKIDSANSNVDSSKVNKGDSSNAKGNTYAKGNTSRIAKGNTSKDVKGYTKQRLSKEELQTNILKFCELEFYSISEIAKHVGKDVEYLKKKVIPLMIDKNLIIRLFPTIINHPQQKYKKHE